MDTIKKNLKQLKRLSKAKAKERTSIINNADDELIKSICEIAFNTLNRNAPLSNTQFRKLSKHKHIVRRLSKKGESIKKKKAIIKQKGGFLPLLITPLLALLAAKFIA